MQRRKAQLLSLIDEIRPMTKFDEDAGVIDIDFADLSLSRQKKLMEAAVRNLDRAAERIITRVRGVEKFTSLSLVKAARIELTQVLNSDRFSNLDI